MNQNYDNSYVCEEAHKRTEKECKKKKIKIDKFTKNNKYVDLSYTKEAQRIFDKHFDEVENEFEQNLIDLQTKN